jgi:RNA polymerase sigma factor (sigma-70 family)
VQTQRQRKMEDPEASDGVLVSRAFNGDQEAFEALVSRYQQSLFGLIYHYVGEYHEAEDVLQQVWLQLYLSLATLRLNAQIKPWLFTVARNRSLDFLRHERLLSQHLLSFCDVVARNEDHEATFIDAIPDMGPSPEELVERQDLQREIWRVIQLLPHKYRSVCVLYYSEQLTFSEIGRILDVPATTVKTRFHRVKPFLRVVFIEQD